MSRGAHREAELSDGGAHRDECAARTSAAEVEPPGDDHASATGSAVLTYRTAIRDANAAGDVHGGWIMKLCDDVALIAAVRHAKLRVVTLAVDGMRFRNPVKVNDVVTLKAMVNAAWTTSLEVGVRVEAEDVLTGRTRHTLTAYITLVALDANGQPTQVRPVTPRTQEQERRQRDANLRRTIRLSEPEHVHPVHGTRVTERGIRI
jgi:acyl-CoA hydrolase